MPEQEKKNPLVELPEETGNFLKFLKRNLDSPRRPEEENLTPEVIGAKRLLESMSSFGMLKEGGIDRERYAELVGQITELEKSLPGDSPSLAVKEMGVAMRGGDAEKYAVLQDELDAIDQVLEEKLGLTPKETHAMVGREDFQEHATNLEGDRSRAMKERLLKIEDRFEPQRKGWIKREVFEADSGFPEHIDKMLERLKEGVPNREEIRPLPEKGTFEYMEDSNPKNPEAPVVCYERQMVKTDRDIVSPDFSSCAGVVLYKLDDAGKPTQETLFTHLPPMTFGDGKPSNFDSYTPDFFKEQFGVDNLDGYEAKVFTGLNIPPDKITDTISQMGGNVKTVEQLPRDMYTGLIDAKTKSIALMGNPESPIKLGDMELSYRTQEGKVPIYSTEKQVPAFIE
ncbi:MAG: hypothetical protein ABH835_03470 [Patescibacteria group bacterium]